MRVTDRQVRKLLMEYQKSEKVGISALKVKQQENILTKGCCRGLFVNEGNPALGQ